MRAGLALDSSGLHPQQSSRSANRPGGDLWLGELDRIVRVVASGDQMGAQLRELDQLLAKLDAELAGSLEAGRAAAVEEWNQVLEHVSDLAQRIRQLLA